MNIDEVLKRSRKKPRKYTVYPVDDTQSVNTLARCIEGIADEICVAIKKKCGIWPRSERRGNHVFLIWPDEHTGNEEIVTDIEIYLA
jgi:hypothetical protein